MDLSVDYLGLSLKHPFIPGASPLSDELDGVKRLEDAGAAAIVLRSLFEEQISQEQMATFQYTDFHRESFAEAASFFPEPAEFRIGPDAYLNHLRKVKQAVKVPVIASLNGTTHSGWLDHARLIEQAGADALELNVYHVASDPAASGQELEKRTVEMVKAIRARAKIPVAVKLSPFYSSLSHFAAMLEAAGASGLVLFNRLFEPTIDIENLAAQRHLQLSDNSELPLRLRWLAILSPQLKCSLAVSGGVHERDDAVRSLMAGAHVVQLVSALLRHGPDRLAKIRGDVARWMEEKEYASLKELRGSMNLASCPDAGAYVRANYMLTLQSWRP